MARFFGCTKKSRIFYLVDKRNDGILLVLFLEKETATRVESESNSNGNQGFKPSIWSLFE
jgi:hypothetical protein